jgi:hypothetical protein
MKATQYQSQVMKRAHPAKIVQVLRDLVVLPPCMNDPSQVQVHAVPDQDFPLTRQLPIATKRDSATYIPSQPVTDGQG